ncbi:MAG: hypothetical protein EOP10_24945 [Proteobacteria bacterium]|nr:MAG: hypothetical protein EOP10_24945 [Pseudomonadota bacterium]
MARYWLDNVPSIPLYLLPMPEDANAEAIATRLLPLQTGGQFNIVVTSFNEPAALGAVARHLEVMGRGDKGRDGLLFAAKSGSFEDLLTFLEDGSPAAEAAGARAPVNFKTLTLLASPVVKSSGTDNFPDYMKAMIYAATVAPEAQIDPSRPFHSLTLKDLPAPLEEDEFSEGELENLVTAGYAVYGVTFNRDSQLLRAVTTYTKNAAGNPDDSFTDINIPLTMSRLRYSFVSYFFNKFISARYKLASDDSLPPPGALVLQPKTAKPEAFTVFDQWAEKQYIEDTQALRQSLVVEKDRNYLIFSFAPNLIEILLGVAGKAVMVR